MFFFVTLWLLLHYKAHVQFYSLGTASNQKEEREQNIRDIENIIRNIKVAAF